MSSISTHILDIARGRPANSVAVSLEMQNADESWTELSHAWTDEDGRVKPFFLLEQPIEAGTYRLVFDTESYFSELKIEYQGSTLASRRVFVRENPNTTRRVLRGTVLGIPSLYPFACIAGICIPPQWDRRR